MADWKFNAYRFSDHEYIGQLDFAKDKQVSPALNNPGACSCRIPLDHDLAYLLEPHSYYIKCLRDGYEKFRGRVMVTTETGSSGWMSINCVGLWQIVNHRYTVAEITFNNMTCGQIANQLLKHSELNHGTHGFDVNPVDPVVGFVIPKLTIPKDANIGEWIKRLTSVENGIDFKYNYVFNWFDFYASGTLGQTRDDVHFGFRAGPTPNCSDVARTKDGSRTVNKMKVISQVSGASIPYQIDAASVAARNAWCEVQTINVRNDPVGSEGDTMVAYAAAELVVRGTHLTTYTVTPMADDSGVYIPPAWDAFDVCDIVKLSADRGALQMDAQSIRVFGWTSDIDDDTGAERLSSVSLSP